MAEIIKIGLDAGHGLNTAGKQTPDGIKEWTLNDIVRDKIMYILNEYNVQFVNVDGDEGNTDEGLTARRNAYLAAGVKAFVSIHHNANTGMWNEATGVEVYTDRNYTEQDDMLANLIYKNLVAYTGLKGRGVKRANFAVINQNSVPAVLCEGGFMDGTSDYQFITSENGQNMYAKAVAEALIEFLGLQKNETSTETSTSTVDAEVKTETTTSTTTATTSAATTAPTPVVKLTVDGKWGCDTTKKTQEVLKTTVDGIVSHQSTGCKKYLLNALTSSWKFDDTKSGSMMVKAIQNLVGVTADGLMGKNTVKLMQTFLANQGINVGTPDGYMGEKTVKGWQTYINSRL